MTNPRKELLTLWTNLKTKIRSDQPLLKKKSLIKDALELHLSQASFFTSEHSQPSVLWNPTQRKEELTRQLATTTDTRTQELIRNQLAILEPLLQPNNPTVQAFTKQKAKYQQIVNDCRELLAQLNGEI